MRFCTLLLATFIPFSAQAQVETLARDFEVARDLFHGGGPADVQAVMDATLAMIPRIEGRWIEGQVLFPDGALDPAIVHRGCRLAGFDLTPTGHFGFTLTRTARDGSAGFTTTFSFVGGNTFTRSTDLDAMYAYLYRGQPLDEAGPGQLQGMAAARALHGYAMVHLTAPDVVVIENVGAMPMILLRCPPE